MSALAKPKRGITKRINGGRGHYYKLDGEKVDGVTTIIGDGVPKKALAPWAAREVATYAVANRDVWTQLDDDAAVQLLKEAPYRDRDRAARRGTEVHGYAERLIRGEEVEYPDELEGHVLSYVKFLEEWKPEPVLVEAVVFNRKRRYMGTLDLVARVDGRSVLFDVKTTRSGIFGDVALQLAAYRFAEGYLGPDGDELPMPAVDACAGIWVRADGYDVVPVEAGERQFMTFLYAQQVAAFCRSSRELVGDVVRPGEWE